MKKRLVLSLVFVAAIAAGAAAQTVYASYTLLFERWVNSPAPANCRLIDSNLSMNEKLFLVYDCDGWVMVREFVPTF